MADFITAITDVVSGIFEAILNAFGTAGELVFATAAETGTITGLTPFGWLLAIIIGLPLGTWAFGKLWGVIKSIRAK